MLGSPDGVDAALLLVALLPSLLRKDPEPESTSILTGAAKSREMWRGHDGAFHDAFRCTKATFAKLVNLLCDEGGLKGSGKAPRVEAYEKLMIFTQVLKGSFYRDIRREWQHSISTISTIVRDVSTAFMRCASKGYFMRQPRSTDGVPDRIRTRAKFAAFRDCVGAFDGSHVPASVHPRLHDVFRNRKGFLSQNVFAAVDFDMVFTYVLAGWEGQAHDGRVLKDALTKGFVVLPGRYYLGDAGYALTKYCLVPYRGRCCCWDLLCR
jgi:hypothetical protein